MWKGEDEKWDLETSGTKFNYMIEINDTCTKGTRILIGNEKRKLVDTMISILLEEGFNEISIPIIQEQSMFADKVGNNKNLMYNFKDRGDRDLCLAPEYTAVVQRLAKERFKYEKDLKLFYVQECFRGEKPQAGRYRQFTQLGVEILNPSKNYMRELIELAEDLTDPGGGLDGWKTSENVTRGLDYYKDGKGFEITCDKLGAQKQICGGGEYNGGIGFAIGIDRLLLI